MLKKLEKKEKIMFNKLMTSLASILGSYLLVSVGLKFAIHFAESVISFPFYLNESPTYIKMDRWAYRAGDWCEFVGIMFSIIASIVSVFIGVKYFKLLSLIRKIKKAS